MSIFLLEKNTYIIWDSSLKTNSKDKRPKVALSQEEFEKASFLNIELIYILVEIKWDNKKRTDFHGFDIAIDLRQNKKLLCPIILCSFMPFFDLEKYEKAKILNTPGHYLCQLPEISRSNGKYLSLDEDLLYDINMHVFDFNGMVRTIFHDHENKCDELTRTISDKANLIEIIKEKHVAVFKTISKYIDEKKISQFKEISNRILREIVQEIDINKNLKEGNRLRKILQEYKPKLYGMLPIPLIDAKNSEYPGKRWKVLFIDDQESACEAIRNMFKTRNIVCETANSSEEAFEIISKDEEGAKKISVIISDFRLYEGGKEGGKWQDKQGYQILSEIHHDSTVSKSHYAYAILTSKQGTILDRIKQRSKFPILWFFKADVLSDKDSAFNMFYNRISEVGSEAFFKKHNIPATAVWKKGIPGRIEPSFSYYYKLHIESNDYYEMEEKISRIASEQIQSFSINKELSIKLDFEISLLDTKTNKKGTVYNNINELLDKFRESVLVARRIFWGLRILIGKDIEKIFWLFKPDYDKDTDAKSIEIMKKSIFNTSLGISFKTDPSRNENKFLIKYGLLSEEIKFLEENASKFKVDVSYIRVNNEDHAILWDFLDAICEISEGDLLVETKRILNNLEDRKIVSPKELNSLCEKLMKKVCENKVFREGFNEATSFFYKDLIQTLSDEYRDKLLSIKLPQNKI